MVNHSVLHVLRTALHCIALHCIALQNGAVHSIMMRCPPAGGLQPPHPLAAGAARLLGGPPLLRRAAQRESHAAAQELATPASAGEGGSRRPCLADFQGALQGAVPA